MASDDGDMGVARSEDVDAVIDKELDSLVVMWSDTYAFKTRAIYDGLIRAARRVRKGRKLSDL